MRWIDFSVVYAEDFHRKFSWRSTSLKLIHICIVNISIAHAKSLIDHLQNRATNTGTHIGKVIILPCMFTGSPRNILQLYQDAMEIVRKYGKPDLFITMTCNPKWCETEEYLLLGRSASDGSDIVARIFNIKKDYLISLILKQKCFRGTLSYVYVIEFQKRGLPHMHSLLTLKHNCKISTPDVVNRYISAEILSSTENPGSHDIVMIHGPCGTRCFNERKCSKQYPKQLRPETLNEENDYPYYRRRKTEIRYHRYDGYTIDNTNVVPYSPMLLQLLNSHINVEVVSSIKVVKYLYKGYDATAIIIRDIQNESSAIDHDEIRTYTETRYVAPVEACWRILRKPLQDKSHSIMRLPVHLSNQHSIRIVDEANDEALQTALEKKFHASGIFSIE